MANHSTTIISFDDKDKNKTLEDKGKTSGSQNDCKMLGRIEVVI